jgi:hypothetical protein
MDDVGLDKRRREGPDAFQARTMQTGVRSAGSVTWPSEAAVFAL